MKKVLLTSIVASAAVALFLSVGAWAQQQQMGGSRMHQECAPYSSGRSGCGAGGSIMGSIGIKAGFC